MTKQATPKKRSSFYVDCHLWEDVADKRTARAVELFVGGIVADLVQGTDLATTLWGCERHNGDEDIQQEFPLHLLLEIVRYAVGLDLEALKATPCEKKLDEFKSVFKEWFAPVEIKELQPMW